MMVFFYLYLAMMMVMMGLRVLLPARPAAERGNGKERKEKERRTLVCPLRLVTTAVVDDWLVDLIDLIGLT